MSGPVLVILIHQVVFQGMFFAKNTVLRRSLGVPIRGGNREANRAIVFFALLAVSAFLLGSLDAPPGTIRLLPDSTAFAVAIALLLANLLIGSASLIGLRDSWRVGVLEDQRTDLVETGIYRFTRNPYFLSYLLMFAAYTVLLQNIILLVLTLIAFAANHAMVLKEEQHLTRQHGDAYRRYMERVRRYI
jgi:protein-S-isoprenylcysteine O-methyltransferase Ste14